MRRSVVFERCIYARIRILTSCCRITLYEAYCRITAVLLHPLTFLALFTALAWSFIVELSDNCIDIHYNETLPPSLLRETVCSRFTIIFFICFNIRNDRFLFVFAWRSGRVLALHARGSWFEPSARHITCERRA